MMLPVSVNYYVFQGTVQTPQIGGLGEEFRENVERIVRTNNASVSRLSVKKNEAVQTTTEGVIEINEANGNIKSYLES